MSHSQVIGDAPHSGLPVFRGDGDTESLETLQLAFAYRYSDSWQAGIGLPLLERSRQVAIDGARSWGLGDMSADLGYEVMPELSYSAWKPRGFVFLETTLPTGPSVYDARDSFLVDARGRGFFSAGAGFILLKSFRSFDFSITGEAHHSFSRGATLADGSQVSLYPGWGASTLLSAGISPGMGSFRFGLSFGPVYEGAIRSEGDFASVSESQLVWNASLQAGYLFANDWSGSLAYTDQTLLGPASNVSLSRSVAVALQKRWEL